MTHTHKLIEAKISMRARKEEKKNKEKKRNYNMVCLRQLLLCFFFFAFQLSQVILQYLNKNLVLSNELIKVELPPWKIYKADVSSVSPSSQRIEECRGALPLVKIW